MDIFPDDIDLIKRLRIGDVEAFDIIYEKYSGKLYSFGLKYLKSPYDSMELIQLVFLRVWGFRHKLKKELSFKSFIFTIAYNEICRILRKKHYHEAFIDELIEDNNKFSPSAEEEIDSKIIEERIWQIVERLPERQRKVFKKSRIEFKSTKEIAAELELSPGTIDNYISKSLRFIRQHLFTIDS